jgi:hypothetical protein
VPATVVWDGGPTGQGTDWLDPANWAGDVLPGPADDAVISPAAEGQPGQIALPGSTAVHSAAVGRTLRLTAGALTVGPAASTFTRLALDGGALAPADGATITDSTIDGPGTLTNPAGRTLTLNQSVVNAPLSNGGTLQVLGSYDQFSSYGNTAGAVLRLMAARLSVMHSFTNAGTIELTNSASTAGNASLGVSELNSLGILVSTTLVNAPGGRITTLAGHGGTRVLSANIMNQGTITIGADTDWNTSLTTLDPNTVNSGTINVTGGNLRLTMTRPAGTPMFGSTGVINVAAGRTFTVLAYHLGPGTLNVFTNYTPGASGGPGTLTGGTFNLAGIFRFPGAAIRTLNTNLTLDGPGVHIQDSVTSRDALDHVLGANKGHLTVRNGSYLGFYVPPVSEPNNTGTLDVGPGCYVGGYLINVGTVITGSDARFVSFDNRGGTLRLGDPVGSLTAGEFRYTGTLELDLNGPTAGTEYDQVVAQYPIHLDAQLVVRPGRAAAPGDTFVIINNLFTQPVQGVFAGLPEGAVLTAGGQDFQISYVGGTGNDVTLTRLAPPVVPQVSAVRVGDGSAQRSMVTSLTVAFNTLVTFAGSPAAAFALARDGGGPVGFTATVTVTGGFTTVTLGGFIGAATQSGSLADGTYTLTVRAGQVSTAAGPLDGNGDGTGGDDYAFGAAQGLFRLYGDATGDRRVDDADFALFRQTYGRSAGSPLYLAYLDANADGRIDNLDFFQFRSRYGTALP